MRIIRFVFLLALAILLIGLALANRQMVTLSLIPENWLPGYSVSLPLFLVIFLAIAAGIVIGLVWEWLREAGLRAESARRAAEIARLEREVGGLRETHAAPADEIIAILDAPRPATAAPAPAPVPSASPAAAGLPALR